MMKTIILLPWLCCLSCAVAQRVSIHPYLASDIFAHNDYEQTIPLFTAYGQGVGFIEADIFLVNDSLMVSHSFKDIQRNRRLENMYLKPLDSLIKKNDQRAYPGSEQILTLSIDLKTNGVPTLNRLVKMLSVYPGLIQNKYFKILISGSMPAPSDWNNYPDYIFFDGRPEIIYDSMQWNRIGIVSTSFRNYTTWDGSSVMSNEDEEKIKQLIATVHSRHKKLRFWATPDQPAIWKYLIDRDVDILGTDDVKGLKQFLLKMK
ncbi:MAG: phosphatidylinositol-specific phospholipase C/glycerophosphodiester phosphodiesterase family protein [Saprospiraceae bacterium]